VTDIVEELKGNLSALITTLLPWGGIAYFQGPDMQNQNALQARFVLRFVAFS
jgi:hypothetical protein